MCVRAGSEEAGGFRCPFLVILILTVRPPARPAPSPSRLPVRLPPVVLSSFGDPGLPPLFVPGAVK